MADDGWHKTSSEFRGQTGKSAVDRDPQHRVESLIAMGEAKDKGLDQYRERSTSRHRAELPLQISAVDDLFTNARRNRNQYEDGALPSSDGQQCACSFWSQMKVLRHEDDRIIRDE